MKSFKQFLDDTELPIIDRVMVVSSDGRLELFEGRKWVSGRFENNIGIDQASSGRGQQHAHVYGRKGDQIVVVNVDGSASHKTRGRLHDADAAALRDRGFKISKDNIVEWLEVADLPRFLLS